MKKTVFLIFTLIGLLAFVESSAQRGKKDKSKLENEIDTISYAIGISIATSVQQQKLPDINISKITQAIKDVLNDENAILTVEQSQKVLNDYMTTLQEKKSLEQIEKMAAFLDENKNDPDVIALPSGLQYKILKQGKGISPLPNDRVKTHYKGTLLDGTVFDSSYDRGEPIVFGVNGVIKGWQEALVRMKPGSKWKLYIPPYLGYGDRKSGPIPPNSLLIFEIELISVQ